MTREVERTGSRLDAETLALMGLGFQLCYFFEIHCPACVDSRIALADVVETCACPICGEMRPAAYLAKGFTRGELPFNEILFDFASPYATVAFAAEFRRRGTSRKHATALAEMAARR